MFSKFLKPVLSLMAVVLVGFGLWSCSNEDNSSVEQTGANKRVSQIPFEEEANIYEYLIQYYKIADEIELLLQNENVILNTEFNDRLERISSEDDLKSLFADYGFSNTDNYIQKFRLMDEAQYSLKEQNGIFYSLEQSDREYIFSKILEGSFVDYYGTPITTARTCREQYDIDVSRAKRNYGIYGAGAVATAGVTGGIGGLIVAAGCMITYHNALSDAQEDYEDCVGS